MKLTDYEQRLLEGWEEVFKKGQLTMWIMLALKDGPKHMAEIKQFIADSTIGSLSADDQSMYRALRRYNDAEMINFTTTPGDGGPDRKVYALSTIGVRVLDVFTKHNIVDVFYKPSIRKLITGEL